MDGDVTNISDQDTSQNEAVVQYNTLVPTAKLPAQFRPIFSEYKYFNRIQSATFDTAFASDESMVISAPTGSGKTLIFELAILRLLDTFNSQDNAQFRVIYVAPMKALCEERLLDWHKKFAPLNVNCISVTGDSENISFDDLAHYNVIITTPEKWDSMTRRWRNNKFVNEVVLVMIDEVHLLNDESRGPTLEAIVSRMKTVQDANEIILGTGNFKKIRYIAVSATIPNIEDIAEWLGTRGKPARRFSFGNDTRPVKLNKIVMGYYYNPMNSTPFKFDIVLNYKLPNIILQHSNGKPTIIFCSTRKSVEMTAKHLSQNLTIHLKPTQVKVIRAACNTMSNDSVKSYLLVGIGSHHAGLLPEHRKIVEDLFRNGDIAVLVTTSTLSMGVNLPAHLVIIKSTKYYTDGGYADYNESTLLQMIGRAGRPQFGTTATAIILTTTQDKAKFENMVGGEQCIESNLHKHLTEHLNAEVVLRTITDLGVAMQWLASTFLHIRARKNPKHYAIKCGLTPEEIDRKLLDICQIEINKLSRVGMLTIDQNVSITPTSVGTLMAKYCIHFETMKLFTEVNGNEILQEILDLVSRCHEFSDLFLRVNDKKTLNLLNKCKNRQTIRFPLNGKIKTLPMKINCIIQAVFGCLQILESSLLNDAQRIMRIGERVSKCLAEYLEKRDNCYSALYSALILAKCFHCRLWENSPYLSKQLTGIGNVMSANLAAAGKNTFESLLEANPRNLEMIIHRKSPMGNNIQTEIMHMPQYKLQLHETKLSPNTCQIKYTLRLINSRTLVDKITLNPESMMNLLIADSDNNVLIFKKYKHASMIKNPEIENDLEKIFNNNMKINAHFISDSLVGIDCHDKIEVFKKPTNKKEAPVPIKKNIKQMEDVINNVTAKPQVKGLMTQFVNILKSKQETAKQPVKPNDTLITEEEIESLLESDDFNDDGALEQPEEKLLESSGHSDSENFQGINQTSEVDESVKKLAESSKLQFTKICNKSIAEEMNKNNQSIEKYAPKTNAVSKSEVINQQNEYELIPNNDKMNINKEINAKKTPSSREVKSIFKYGKMDFKITVPNTPEPLFVPNPNKRNASATCTITNKSQCNQEIISKPSTSKDDNSCELRFDSYESEDEEFSVAVNALECEPEKRKEDCPFESTSFTDFVEELEEFVFDIPYKKQDASQKTDLTQKSNSFKLTENLLADTEKECDFIDNDEFEEMMEYEILESNPQQKSDLIEQGINKFIEMQSKESTNTNESAKITELDSVIHDGDNCGENCSSNAEVISSVSAEGGAKEDYRSQFIRMLDDEKKLTLHTFQKKKSSFVPSNNTKDVRNPKLKRQDTNINAISGRYQEQMRFDNKLTKTTERTANVCPKRNFMETQKNDNDDDYPAEDPCDREYESEHKLDTRILSSTSYENDFLDESNTEIHGEQFRGSNSATKVYPNEYSRQFKATLSNPRNSPFNNQLRHNRDCSTNKSQNSPILYAPKESRDIFRLSGQSYTNPRSQNKYTENKILTPKPKIAPASVSKITKNYRSQYTELLDERQNTLNASHNSCMSTSSSKRAATPSTSNYLRNRGEILNKKETESTKTNEPHLAASGQSKSYISPSVASSMIKTSQAPKGRLIYEPEFEDTVYSAEHAASSVHIKNFTRTPRKKLKHKIVIDMHKILGDKVEPDSTIESLPPFKRTKMDFDDNERKGITWRSPLVTKSPLSKYSPKLMSNESKSRLSLRRDVYLPSSSQTESERHSHHSQNRLNYMNSFPCKSTKSFPLTDAQCSYFQNSNRGSQIAQKSSRAFNDILSSSVQDSVDNGERAFERERKFVTQNVAQYVSKINQTEMNKGRKENVPYFFGNVSTHDDSFEDESKWESVGVNQVEVEDGDLSTNPMDDFSQETSFMTDSNVQVQNSFRGSSNLQSPMPYQGMYQGSPSGDTLTAVPASPPPYHYPPNMFGNIGTTPFRNQGAPASTPSYTTSGPYMMMNGQCYYPYPYNTFYPFNFVPPPPIPMAPFVMQPPAPADRNNSPWMPRQFDNSGGNEDINGDFENRNRNSNVPLLMEKYFENLD